MNDARAAGAPDFVDRLVVKAFGGAEVAAARVPSAYEPLRPHAGLAPGAALSERIGEDGMSGDDAMDGDAHESSDRRRVPRSARTPAADGSRALAANAAEEGDRAGATRRRRTRTRSSARGDAADRRDAAASSTRAMDGDDPAGALMATPSVLNPQGSQGSQSGDRHVDDDAAAPIARFPLDAAALHSATSGGQDANAPDADQPAHVVQPSARLRASLDTSPFMREPGGEDGAAAESRRDANESLASDGTLMPVAHGVAPHAADDRGGWREPASRRWADEADATTSDVTVNVTIGRVDVRAVQAAAPAERPARTRGAQPIALDEYLARHGGAR